MTRLQVAGFKSIGALIAGFTMFMLEIVNEALIVLVFLMMLDMLTGVMRSFLTKSWNSTVGMAGIIKKVAVILLIGMAGAIEYMLLSVSQDGRGILIIGVTSFFIVNEGISILENCAQIGLPIPSILYNALEKLHKDPFGRESGWNVIRRWIGLIRQYCLKKTKSCSMNCLRKKRRRKQNERRIDFCNDLSAYHLGACAAFLKRLSTLKTTLFGTDYLF